MVPKEWFEQEKKNREERTKKRNGLPMDRNFEPRRVASEYLLSGLVVCGHLEGEEHPMNIEHIPAKKGQRGNYTFFVCTTAKNSRNQHCFAKRISIRSIEQAVIDNLMTHVLTMENLRPMAVSLAESLQERSRDAGTRIIMLENELVEVQKSLNNILDAFERMGYATHLQQRYDKRKKEEEELTTELSRLKALQVSPKHIAAISDDMLEGWIQFMRQALEGEDKSVAKRVIRQFVAKIVIKDGTGTLYYTFPFPDDLYMSSYGNLDLKRLELMTSSVRLTRSPRLSYRPSIHRILGISSANVKGDAPRAGRIDSSYLQWMQFIAPNCAGSHAPISFAVVSAVDVCAAHCSG
jgi:hypothetical protein